MLTKTSDRTTRDWPWWWDLMLWLQAVTAVVALAHLLWG